MVALRCGIHQEDSQEENQRPCGIGEQLRLEFSNWLGEQLESSNWLGEQLEQHNKSREQSRTWSEAVRAEGREQNLEVLKSSWTGRFWKLDIE